ncbi:Peptidase C78 ubiquitin fold modifier-specific peptidase 1/ 2 protein [Dioscorea alata]|uniref:Peptidase C78 ubiquitin fold modifier-specific peptidase 1/ 2 protein n=1 Tax=Dioscorea alata TaxID=55571 RepID=A0ACB7W1P0_DIOAL|nr:Peptidase C78 ubiquitin fold modifier-specific peptidase 1/ 2 protein [Dioscorea alata]
MAENGGPSLRILCPKKRLVFCRDPAIYWLIGSPLFFPRFTIISSFRCLHSLPGDPLSPDFSREADDLKTLLLRGFDVIGALIVSNGQLEENSSRAIATSLKMRNFLFNSQEEYDMIGATSDLESGEIHFFFSETTKHKSIQALSNIIYEASPENYIWDTGCLLRCELEFKLPVFIPVSRVSDADDILSSSIAAVAAKFKDPNVAYLIETPNVTAEKSPLSVVLHGSGLDFNLSKSMPSTEESNMQAQICADFCSKDNCISSPNGKSADTIQVTIFYKQTRRIASSAAPSAQYYPVSEPTKAVSISFKLDVLCYASKDFPLAEAVSKLLVPGLTDQLLIMKSAIMPKLLSQHPQIRPYHFFPSGLLHPITALYELTYGENEEKQGDIRKALHSRLGLHLDRPLLRIVNALTFGINGSEEGNSKKVGSLLLRDVHTEIAGSGVSGGITSLIDGSYEYYHYLHGGIDDNGWGCAYRSLQTIISWFRLQHYTSVEVPSHRAIQQALVEIGDKEPSFVGSREWIGAIELSFVLDKLLGVTCKIMNVRSGLELPEKCRELAIHFETQGTPVMIGGGVLAYTLLGVDFNEANGDCAFLILDPHYTGNDDLKKIISSGWCGWKKAVDSKGRHFFLADKFYNLLLPQRPNMV